MPLETTVVVVDSTEWSRNGDYTPTRLGAAYDAATLLLNAKLQSHPESTVGMLSFASE
jgi:26S proteasome regulatory subunit N10